MMMKSALLFSLLFLLAACQTSDLPDTVEIDGRRIIGYWHCWKGGTVAYFPLKEVPPYVNQVNVAFAYPDTAASKRLGFPHEEASDAEMRAQIRSLQERGIDVLISVGGGNHPIELESAAERDRFADSLIQLVERFGFDGIDLNLEGVSAHLDEGDTDFRNPVTPKIRNLIAAVERVDDHFEGRKRLSVAPETQYVVGGYAKYGGKFGGYLPVLHALRDRLDLVQLQLYNSGSQYVYNGDPGGEPTQIVEPATADFVVGLTEMMIRGFPVANDPDAYFEGFPPSKVVVGLTCTPEEMGNGSLAPEAFRSAMFHLMTGTPMQDSAYRLRTPGGYPELAGVMTWSLNWDRAAGAGRGAYPFVRQAGEVLREVVGGGGR